MRLIERIEHCMMRAAVVSAILALRAFYAAGICFLVFVFVHFIEKYW